MEYSKKSGWHAGKVLIKDNVFVGNYLEWLNDEFTGWNRFAWALFGFGAALQIQTFITNPISWQTTVTMIASIIGFLCTVAMATDRIDAITGERIISCSVNGLLGLVAAFGFITVNAVARHWWSILDQCIFIALIDLPILRHWRTWNTGDNGTTAKKLTKKGIVGTIIALIIGWIVLYFAGILLKDSNPLWDAAVLSLGATASWLCYKRYASTFILWLIEDILNIILWYTSLHQGITQASLPMLLTSILYLVSAIFGRYVWHKDLSKNTK